MCPGGGFNLVAMDHEGYAFADWFHQQGITYAVLKYRMPHGHVEIIREDIREAVSYTHLQTIQPHGNGRRQGRERHPSPT